MVAVWYNLKEKFSFVVREEIRYYDYQEIMFEGYISKETYSRLKRIGKLK